MSVLFEYSNGSNPLSVQIPFSDPATDKLGQTFTVQAGEAHILVEVALKLARANSPGTIYIDIYATAGGYPTGSSLGQVSYDGNSLEETGLPHPTNFDFDPGISLDAETAYAIVLTVPNGSVATNKIYWNKSSASYSNGKAVKYTVEDDVGSWADISDTDFYFKEWGIAVPEKPINPAPEYEEEEVGKRTGNLTWVDGGGDTATFNIHFGTTSDSLTELETEIDVGSPLWPAPMVVLEINDYNPAIRSGYRSPIVGDILTHGNTTYTLWAVIREDLVNVQYEAKLYAVRVGPVSNPGNVLTNGVEPDPDDPQAVKVTLNDAWHFHGEVESAYYPCGNRYYWRVDAINEAGTTTGDEWFFDIIPCPWGSKRPPYYNHEDEFWRFEDGEYKWSDVNVSGGGRYKQQLVAIGHNCVYYGSM